MPLHSGPSTDHELDTRVRVASSRSSSLRSAPSHKRRLNKLLCHEEARGKCRHDARLAEDDVLADDSFFDVPENREQATEEPQGWSRKKSQVVSASSGDEGGNLDAGEPGKGGRRKIVRPTIGGRFEDNELGDKFTLAAPEVEKDPRQHRNVSSASGDHNTFVQQGSPGVMMDIEMNTGEAKDGRNSFQDSASANAAAVCREFTSTSVFGGSSGFEADNMMS